MKQTPFHHKSEPRPLPHLGQRIIKTTVAVFLCLLFYYLRRGGSADLQTEAAITAIICMQPYVRDSREYAVNRFAGTLIGAFWGLLFLLLMLLFPALAAFRVPVYALMATGVLLSLYSSVLLRRPDASSLAAIVFLCVVIAFPDISSPLRQALDRILGVLLGTTAAIVVNTFRLPRDKNRDVVFFVRMKDLAPDRFSRIPAAAMFRLNYLYQDGAKICLISEHAPAFFALQMDEPMLRVPLIVMDGAAIYDAAENVYLSAETIAVRDVQRLRYHLDSVPFSYFIYTVHKNKTCIFHHGELREAERRIYERMRRSPYRSYLDEDAYLPEETVYFKILADRAQTEALLRGMQGLLHSSGLRAVIRREAGAEEISALYIYASRATPRLAQARLMQLLRERDGSLRSQEIFADAPYRSEHDAMVLLSRLGRAYEPVRLFCRKR